MSKQKPALSQRALALELGISQPMVCRYQQQGMPADVEGARVWMRRLNRRVKTGLDRHAQLRRQRPPALEEPEDDYPGAPGEVSLFICGAMFAATHGPRRFAPLLVHIASCMSEAGWAAVSAMDEVPERVWAVWDEARDAYIAALRVTDDE